MTKKIILNYKEILNSIILLAYSSNMEGIVWATIIIFTSVDGYNLFQLLINSGIKSKYKEFSLTAVKTQSNFILLYLYKPFFIEPRGIYIYIHYAINI